MRLLPPDFWKRIETWMFKGLEPGAAAKLPLSERLSRWLDKRLDRLVKPGAAPNDPFYASHLGWRRKLLRSLIVIVPLVIVGLGILATTTDVFSTRHIEKAFLVPDVTQKAKDSSVDVMQALLDASELEVSQLALERETPPVITGEVRNNSDAVFEAGEISFNILNDEGAVVGSVGVTVHNIPAHGSAHFRVEVPQQGAAMALVRDARRIVTKKQ